MAAAATTAAAAAEPPFRVADLIDKHGGTMDSDAWRNSPIRVLDPGLINYGGRKTFYGQVVTLQTLHHNPGMKKILLEEGAGRVLVVDGRGSLKCALMGDAMTARAQAKGWSGIVVNGAVRDGKTMGEFDIGICALGLNPQKPGCNPDVGERDVPVSFCGVTINAGDWIYCDDDGALVSPHPLEFPPSKATHAAA